jgi:hypothetical protein
VAGVAALLATRGSPAPSRPGRALAVSRGATSRTTDRFGLGDVGIANFLLTLQHIERDLYGQALASGALRPRTRGLIGGFAAQEAEHVARLERTIAALGTRTVRPPRVSLPLASESAFVQYAVTVEGLVASACLGQLRAINTRLLLDAVLAIHTVDARHAGALNELVGLDPAPDGPIAQPADAATVLAKLRPILRR